MLETNLHQGVLLFFHILHVIAFAGEKPIAAIHIAHVTIVYDVAFHCKYLLIYLMYTL